MRILCGVYAKAPRSHGRWLYLEISFFHIDFGGAQARVVSLGDLEIVWRPNTLVW